MEPSRRRGHERLVTYNGKVAKQLAVANFQEINSRVIPNSLGDLGRFLYWSPPELCLLCAPDSSATLSAICTGTIVGHLHRDPPNLISHPEPSRTWPFETSSGICIGTLRNFVCYLHPNPPASHQPSTPEPSRTLRAICTGTLWNPLEPHQLISHLHRNRPEPHQLFARNRLHRNPSEPYLQSAPELSGTSSAFCPKTLRNLISHLHRNPPEPCLLSAPNLISHLHRNPPEPHQQSAPEGSGTLRNLLRNLVLHLHRIAPELFWAKDPLASFAVGEKISV